MKEIDIINEFMENGDNYCHSSVTADYEHSQWFVTCLDCGAQWSVHKASGRDGDYLQFDEITLGDEYCYGVDQ